MMADVSKAVEICVEDVVPGQCMWCSRTDVGYEEAKSATGMTSKSEAMLMCLGLRMA